MNRSNTEPFIRVTHEPSLKTWVEYTVTLALVMAVGLLVLMVLGPTPRL
jgi:hypothetical protein